MHKVHVMKPLKTYDLFYRIANKTIQQRKTENVEHGTMEQAKRQPTFTFLFTEFDSKVFTLVIVIDKLLVVFLFTVH